VKRVVVEEKSFWQRNDLFGVSLKTETVFILSCKATFEVILPLKAVIS
jgi:hypothetical protein